MLKTSSITDQVAAHLRDGLQRRHWAGHMPGRSKLAEELGVNVKTVERALIELEREGLLESQGAGKRRRIVVSKQQATPATQVKMILYERDESYNPYVLEIRRALLKVGHNISYAPKTLLELKQDPRRVAKMIEADTAKVWIACGAARPVLEFFAENPVPMFALFGRMLDLSIAGTGPDKRPAISETLSHLSSLGHRRIVMLTREERRKPDLGLAEKLFLDELRSLGIASSSYNLPDWEETPSGLNSCLDELFKLTPPTALIVSDSTFCLAVKNYLASHRGRDLRNVALICTDYHQTFDWCVPPIAHFHWDTRPIVRRVVRWVNNVAAGKDDRRQKLYPAKFIGGETLKPVEVNVS